MGDITGFLKHGRQLPPRRPVAVRIQDWREVYEPSDDAVTREQASRCMDCGIPFCHNGCPLGNLIPEWNDLVYRDRWRDAIDPAARHQQLSGVHRPALPGAVRGVLRARHQPGSGDHRAGGEGDHRAGLGQRLGAADAAGAADRQAGGGGRLRPGRAGRRPAADPGRASGDRVRTGRPDRAACSATASPSSRWRSGSLDRRIQQMVAEGTEFRTGVQRRGRPAGRAAAGRVTTRWCWPAARPHGGTCRSRAGSWPASTRRWSSCRRPTGCSRAIWTDSPISAEGKRVVIIGGGDTGADCLGTSHRQGARPRCTSSRSWPSRRPLGRGANPWPTWPLIYRTASAHEEGGERVFAVNTERFVDDGQRPSGGAAGARGGVRRRPVRQGARAPTSTCRAIWCCWRWDSSGRSGPVC